MQDNWLGKKVSKVSLSLTVCKHVWACRKYNVSGDTTVHRPQLPRPDHSLKLGFASARLPHLSLYLSPIPFAINYGFVTSWNATLLRKSDARESMYETAYFFSWQGSIRKQGTLSFISKANTGKKEYFQWKYWAVKANSQSIFINVQE